MAFSLRGILTPKAAPPRAPTDAPVQPDIQYLNMGDYGVAVVRFDDHIAMEMALRHPIVYRALNKIAEAVSQVRWMVEIDQNASPSEQEGNVVQRKALQSALDHPNPDMTPAQFRYWLALNYAGYGRVPMKVTWSVDNAKVNGLYPLEVRQVSAVFNSRGVVEAYEYGSGEGAQRWPARAEWRPRGELSGAVIQIWKPGLKGYQHRDDVSSPLQAIGLPAQVIKSLLIRAIKTADGHPNVRYMVTCSKTLTSNQMDALRKHLAEESRSGGVGSGSVPILQNAADVEIHKLDNDLSDIHSKVPSDDMARLIFGAFGIPLAVSGIGASDAAKFTGNFADSRVSFWQDTVLPAYVEPLFQSLSKALCPPGLVINPDRNSIPALLAARVEAMRAVSFVSFLTTDEKRALFGLGPTTELPQNPFDNQGAAAQAGASETRVDENGNPKPDNQHDQQEQ